MSNHWHGVITDPHARLPEFLERAHRLIARAMNDLHGRFENFWSSDKTSVVRLVDDEDVLDKMAYTIANPTIAGLVRDPREWPGVLTTHVEWSRTIERPETFFDPRGPLPNSLELQLTRPPIYQHLNKVAFEQRLARAVATKVARARKERTRSGRAFLGAKKVLLQSPTAVPREEDIRRKFSPRIAAKNHLRRVDAIRRLLTFERTYRSAWLMWRSGIRDVVFPAGTYALRINACVACAPISREAA